MRRVVSVWFPHWPTDRLRRRLGTTDAPRVTALHDGGRRVIAAADPAAEALGLRPGLAVAQALALVPGLDVVEAELESDADALRRLALWCHALTPLAAPCPDGLWLDVTGCAHLAGGESALLHRLVDRLARDGLNARAAVADTPGCAHAVARFGPETPAVVPPGTQDQALAPLPVAALRISPELGATLGRLGFEQVAHLVSIPRALLARRFGPLLGLRLDQAHGRVQEPVAALAPEHPLQHRLAFAEPLLTAESFQAVIPRLAGPLCTEMERLGLGARQLDLLFERVDGHVAAIRIGTAHPSRDAPHLARMLLERLETIDPGLGVEAMRLVASVTQPLDWEQQQEGAGAQEVARLVDRLANRLGAAAVYRAAPVATDLPEHMTQHADPATHPGRALLRRAQRNHHQLVGHAPSRMAQPSPRPGNVIRFPVRSQEAQEPDDLDQDPPLLPWLPKPDPHRPGPHGPETDRPWPNRLHAPPRLFAPPRPVTALAALPDAPPIAFTWRRRHRIRRAEGPERIFGEWWHPEGETGAVRDYFIVEDEEGQRFWLFRRGNGLDPGTGDLEWFLHGLF